MTVLFMKRYLLNTFTYSGDDVYLDMFNILLHEQSAHVNICMEPSTIKIKSLPKFIYWNEYVV